MPEMQDFHQGETVQVSYKFRLYPTSEQEQNLLWTLDKCREDYNQMLEGLNNQERPNGLELQSKILKLKEQHPGLKGVHSKVLQMVVYQSLTPQFFREYVQFQ
jgi:putative transposase